MQSIDLSGLTMCFGNVALAAGSTTTLTSTGTPAYCVNGKPAAVTSVTNVQPFATDANTGSAVKTIPPGYGCVFVVGVNATFSTTYQWVQGEIVPLRPADSATDYSAAKDWISGYPEFPVLPDGFCPVGYIVAKVASTQAVTSPLNMFTNLTTATGAQNSNTTAYAITYTSVCTLPNRPVAV